MNRLRLAVAGVLDALLDAAELLEQNDNASARIKLNHAIELSLALSAMLGLERSE